MAPLSKLKPECVGFYKYHDVILGKGNFATVYLARHKVTGCEVALKVINTDDIEEEYVLRNLTREARILRDLHHPNIIRLYETVKSVNLYCLSLELIRGVNLYQYMMKQDGRRISEKMARIFFYQMLSAVQYMHHLHVIHRDLKLENILIEFGHVVKIVDFGLSNVYYPCYRLRTHCGSVEYAAPELFRSMSAYGSAADLWSLGVILYAMVVGKMPFMFCREKSENQESTRKRELFVKRISKGLMQENWELMEDLSPDCWDLLHDLLKPDQFRRIRIEEAITHQWITKDEHLKRRLPQKRKDLQRKFRPEIINFLAHKLNTSITRIEKHINVHTNDKIACMFYIVRDVLVKEVLYPPKEFETSFLYRFECWRQNQPSLLLIQQNSELCEREACEEYGHIVNDEQATVLTKSVSTSSSKVIDKSREPSTSNTDSKDLDYIKSQSHLKRRDILEPPITRTKKTVRSSCSFSASKDMDLECKNEDSIKQKKISRNPYRSYKNSRPEKVKASHSEIKAIHKPFDLQYDSKRKSSNLMKEKLHEKEYPISHHTQMNGESDNKGRDSSKSCKGSTLISNSKLNKQSISKTHIKSKTSDSKTLKTTCHDERKVCSTRNLKKSSSSLNDGSADLNNPKSPKPKVDVAVRIMKNCRTRETLRKKMEGNRISLLTRTKPTDDHKINEVSMDIGQADTSSRIPIKNFRYGPPAPFSQPINTAKTIKSGRATVADRISLCRGDTAERLA